MIDRVRFALRFFISHSLTLSFIFHDGRVVEGFSAGHWGREDYEDQKDFYIPLYTEAEIKGAREARVYECRERKERRNQSALERREKRI